MSFFNRLGLDLPLTPDTQRLVARAGELATGACVRRDTLLRAFWDVEVPGTELLRCRGVTREALGGALDSPDEGQEQDGWAMADIMLSAGIASRESQAAQLCDSIQIAEALLRKPWGVLKAYLDGHPVSKADWERAVREVRLDAGSGHPILLELTTPWKAAPALGRERELERLQEVLVRSRHRGAVITGAPGCGKSALVSGLAHLLRSGGAPPALRDVTVLELDRDRLEPRWRKEGKDAVRAVLQAAQETGTVLGVDDLELWIQRQEFTVDLLEIAAELKVRLLVTSTLEAANRVTQLFPSLGEELEMIALDPLDAAACVPLAQALRGELEERYGLHCQEECLQAVPELAHRYLQSEASPANVVSLLDGAFAPAALQGRQEVILDDAQALIENRTGIPVRGLGAHERETLRNLEAALTKRVIGQADAVNRVARAIRRSRAGLREPNQPIGSFLFTGPSGVGKTELAKATAEVLFGSEQDLLVFDMSEYKEEENVWGLIGPARGYKMADQGGTLTEPVRAKPYCVVLLDEIEKANPAVLDILLQVLDEGRLTDGVGRRVDFRNTIVVMTSNLTAELTGLARGEIGFLNRQVTEAVEHDPEIVDATLRRVLRPEFINRIDDVVEFRTLGVEELTQIAGLQLQRLAERLAAREVTLEPTPDAMRWLAEHGRDPKYGARPLRRLIQERIADPLVDLLLEDEDQAGRSVRIELEDGELTLATSRDAPRVTP
ncbi:MAG TPA: ATP-dependent Clp protease ATP-binding subunit [Candidatus Dormibacteraeota bacterium]|nr:ATP-dependent Clp protease ATP-binding subunit [Candidatus Dormibacteraeota bacterium]